MSARELNWAEQAAQRYAGVGWPVFPCRTGDKIPATRNGLHDATTDPGKIAWWWSKNPERNVGIATGAPGPDVLDIDNHGAAGNGFGAFRQLRQAGIVPDAAAVIRTPSNGAHAYFAGSGQRNGRLPRHHIDFRGAGGYVLAPPSRVNGRAYEVVTHGADAGGLSWQAVRDFLEPQRERREPATSGSSTDADRLARWVSRLQEADHNRNDGLFYAACRVAEAGQDPDCLADAALSIGLTKREIDRTLDSARKTASRPFQGEAG